MTQVLPVVYCGGMNTFELGSKMKNGRLFVSGAYSKLHPGDYVIVKDNEETYTCVVETRGGGAVVRIVAGD